MPKMRLGPAKYVVALTIIVGLFYGILFLYLGGYIFPQQSCPEMGGVCREACGAMEKEIGKCNSLACCLSGATELNSEAVRRAMLERDITKCIGTGADAACELAVLDMINADFAKKYGDVGYCDKISNIDTKDFCLRDMAQQLSSIDLCHRISSNSMRDKCLTGFVNGKEDWEICGEELDSEFSKDICFEKLALLTNSIEPCNQLSLQQAVYGCYLRVELSKGIGNVYCDGLARNTCAAAKGCQPILISDVREAVSDVYIGCKRDEKYFCETTGGRWIVTPSEDVMKQSEEECICEEGKAYFEEYGCFRCPSLQTPYAIAECNRRLPAHESAS